MLVIRTALIALAATAVAGGALAQGKPAARKPVQTAANTARQDQSYLYLTPSSAPRGKLPDYAVAGSAPRDQVYVGTMFDNLGPTGLRR